MNWLFRVIERVPLKQKLAVRSTVREKSEIMAIRFGHEDSLVAVGSNDGFIRGYNMVKSTKLSQVNTNVKDK